MGYRLHLKRRTGRRVFKGIEARAKASLPQRVGEGIADKIRRGRGGLRDQFARQQGNILGVRVPWTPPKEPFGSRPPGKRMMHRSGKLRAAWLGKSSKSVTRVERRRVIVGVDDSRGGGMERAGVFQDIRPTRIGVTQKMRRFLAWKWGVAFSPGKKFVTISPRRLGIGANVMKQAAKIFEEWVGFGRKP